MEEEVNTKKKGSKKPLIICLSIIIVLAIVAGVVCFLLIKSGKLNFSKKAKLQAGVDQLTESLIKPVDDIKSAAESGDLTVKVFNNISKDSPVSAKIDFSGKLDTVDIEGMSYSEQEIIDAVKDVLADSKISTELKYDGKGNVYVNGAATMDGNSVSGEVLYKDEELLFRIKDLAESWIKIPKEEIMEDIDMTKQNLEDLQEQMETIMKKSEELAKKTEIDTKTADEIQERYEKVLKDFLAGKEKDIEKSKDKVKVDGKEKSCQKLSVTLNEKDIKNLAKAYIKEFKNDSQLQGIVKNYITEYSNTLNEMAEELDTTTTTTEIEDLSEQWEELIDELDELEKAIDETDLNGFKVTLTVYATNTEVYRTDIKAGVKGVDVTLATTFGKSKTTTKISATGVGEIATLEIEDKENGAKYTVELADKMAAQMNVDKFKAELEYTISGTTQELAMNVDAGSYAKGSLKTTSTVKTNTDNEYVEEMTISADITSKVATIKGSLSSTMEIKVGDASMPSVSESDVIDSENKADQEKYTKEASKNLKDSSNAIRKFVLNSKLEKLYELATGDSLKEEFEDFIKEMETPSVTPTIIENTEPTPIEPAA